MSAGGGERTCAQRLKAEVRPPSKTDAPSAFEEDHARSRLQGHAGASPPSVMRAARRANAGRVDPA